MPVACAAQTEPVAQSVDTEINVTVEALHWLPPPKPPPWPPFPWPTTPELPVIAGVGAALTVVACDTVIVYVETTPALPVIVSVTVSWATTAEAVYVLVSTLAEEPAPTVTYTVDRMGAAVVVGVWTAAEVETVLVRTCEPRVTVMTVSTGSCEVTVW